MKRSLIVVAIVCVSVVSLTAAIALAASKTYTGHTTFALAEFRMSGKLTSSLPACEKGRYITIYTLGNGGSAASTATTDSDGDWKTGTGFFDPNGTYVAKTPAKVLPKQGKLIRKCAAVTARRTFKAPAP
jgi:hypothetical protein